MKKKLIIISIIIIILIIGFTIFILNSNNNKNVSSDIVEYDRIYDYIDSFAIYNDKIIYVIDDSISNYKLHITYNKNAINLNVYNEGNNHYIDYNYKDNKIDNNDIDVQVISNENNINNIIKNTSFVKHVVSYKNDTNIIIEYGEYISDSEVCILNNLNYYDCK